MSRIAPVTLESGTPEQKAASVETAADHAIANMKTTLAQSPVALRSALKWYLVFDPVRGFLREREETLCCHAISCANRCELCSLFLRRAIVVRGEAPDRLVLDERAQTLTDCGRTLALDAHGVSDGLYDRLKSRFTDVQIVDLPAFGALRIVNNLINSAFRLEPDESLRPYRASPEVLFG